MDPWHRVCGVWYGAGAVPDSVTAAVLQSQPMSPCPLGPRGQAGRGCAGTGGAGSRFTRSRECGWWVMDEACPGLCDEIIPSLPAPPAHGRHLSHARADVTLQDPGQGGLTSSSQFFPGTRGFGPLAPGCEQVDL